MEDYYLEKSNRKDKKFMISYINAETGKINTIQFGAKRMSDYTINKDDERKKRYILRHQKNEDWDDIKTAGFFSKNLLWNMKTLKSSIKDTEKKFNIKIHFID